METIRESVKRGMGGAIYGIASVTIFVRKIGMSKTIPIFLFIYSFTFLFDNF